MEVVRVGVRAYVSALESELVRATVAAKEREPEGATWTVQGLVTRKVVVLAAW